MQSETKRNNSKAEPLNWEKMFNKVGSGKRKNMFRQYKIWNDATAAGAIFRYLKY